MKSLEQILDTYKSKTLDGRDLNRLIQFIPEPLLVDCGIQLKPEYVGNHIAIDFNRENILIQLEKDVEFGFERH